jgi:hypothetical protein
MTTSFRIRRASKQYLHVTTALVAVLAAGNLRAQTQQQIGATSAGTPVMLETKSVKKANGIITAALRVGLQPVIKTANGDMVAMRSIAMIDCAAKTTATKERWFYYDAKGTKVARHDVPGKPGFGPAIKGSLPDVALAHFCTSPAK